MAGTGSLLWHPIAYIALTMPLLVTRLAEMEGQDWGEGIAFTSASLYTFGDFVNVVLYTSEWNGLIRWKWGAWRQTPAWKLSFYLADTYSTIEGTDAVLDSIRTSLRRRHETNNHSTERPEVLQFIGIDIDNEMQIVILHILSVQIGMWGTNGNKLLLGQFFCPYI